MLCKNHLQKDRELRMVHKVGEINAAYMLMLACKLGH